VKRPASDRLSDRLESFVAGRRAEQDAEGTSPAPRQPQPERVAEKVERLVWVVSAPIFILAVDDFRLLRMKRQSAVSEPPLKRCAQRPRLRLTAAVASANGTLDRSRCAAAPIAVRPLGAFAGAPTVVPAVPKVSCRWFAARSALLRRA
jgi:hypothetical protein